MAPRREAPSGSGAGEARTLRQALGPGLLAVLIVGDVLGAGIYLLVGEVAGDVGGLVWLPFLIAFGLAALTAASYTELVCAHPHAAGAAHYVDLAFGRRQLTFAIGFVVAASSVSTAAATSRAVGGRYLEAFVTVPVVPVALAVIALLALVSWLGVSESARANAVMTAVEVGGLVLVVVAGVWGLGSGTAEPARLLDAGTTGVGALGIMGASALAFFAYLGFEDAVHLSEEVHHPRRSFPRAMVIGMAVIGVLYLAVAASVAMLVDAAHLAASSTPLLEAVELGPVPVSGRFFAVIAIVAVANTALVAITTSSRLVYGLAEQGAVPGWLGGIGRRRTPTPAIVAVALVVAALASTGEVRDLADTTVALLLAVFAVVNVTVLVLRRRDAAAPDPGTFRTPRACAALGATASAVLLVDTLWVGGPGLLVRVAALLALGGVLYGLSLLGGRTPRR